LRLLTFVQQIRTAFVATALSPRPRRTLDVVAHAANVPSAGAQVTPQIARTTAVNQREIANHRNGDGGCTEKHLVRRSIETYFAPQRGA
jgi:hypothetical protein